MKANPQRSKEGFFIMKSYSFLFLSPSLISWAKSSAGGKGSSSTTDTASAIENSNSNKSYFPSSCKRSQMRHQSQIELQGSIFKSFAAKD